MMDEKICFDLFFFTLLRISLVSFNYIFIIARIFVMLFVMGWRFLLFGCCFDLWDAIGYI